eukprot:NODE_17_length_48642_cov_1.199349.p13 type:complete len:381 gc:universal NODE_17_length_48642_cov_1.199349:19206-20348(+)
MKTNYSLIEEIGNGSYGTVYKAVNNTTGALVALKQVSMEDGTIMKEIEFMKSCNNEYIIGLDDYYIEEETLYIAMEFCPAGSIADVMKYTELTLNEKQIQSVVRDALYGLDYLHQRLAIHRDIKAGNLLLTKQGRVKLGDFGVSASLSDAVRKRNTVIGTPYWMAPEIIQEIGYNTSADIWSLGITIIEMADSKPPFHHIHPMRAIFMIPNKPPPTVQDPPKWSSKFNDFVKCCLEKIPDERPTARQLINHDFVKNAPESNILLELVQLSLEIKSRRKFEKTSKSSENIEKELDQVPQGTIRGGNNSGTTVIRSDDSSKYGTTVYNTTRIVDGHDSGTMVLKLDEDDKSATIRPNRYNIIASNSKTIRPSQTKIDVLSTY